MIEQIYTFFTMEMIYLWLNTGVLPFWFILVFFPNSKICGLLVTSVFPFFVLTAVMVIPSLICLWLIRNKIKIGTK